MGTYRSDAEWARSVERRLQQIERPTILRVGGWTLSETVNHGLIAEHADGRVRIIDEGLDVSGNPAET